MTWRRQTLPLLLLLLGLAGPGWAQSTVSMHPACTPTHVRAGTGTETARLGGVIHTDFTAAATLGTAEETVASYTLPANTLSADGKALRVKMWGLRTSNTNSGTVRVRVGGAAGTLVCDYAMTAAGMIGWHLELIIGRRTANGNQSWYCGQGYNSGTLLHVGEGTRVLPMNTATDIDFVARAISAGAAGELTFSGWIFETLN